MRGDGDAAAIGRAARRVDIVAGIAGGSPTMPPRAGDDPSDDELPLAGYLSSQTSSRRQLLAMASTGWNWRA